jgi:hypothetical protein
MLAKQVDKLFEQLSSLQDLGDEIEIVEEEIDEDFEDTETEEIEEEIEDDLD